MNPLFSVRFRLFALCVSLLTVLGGANLLLGNINRQHEVQVARLQEQYRRVSVIYSVQEAMVTYRFWQGQVNDAQLTKSAEAERRSKVRLEEASQTLDRQLSQLDAFDAEAVRLIRGSLPKLRTKFSDAVAALVRHDTSAEALIGEVNGIIQGIEGALTASTRRQEALANEEQSRARSRAATAQRVSLAIILFSSLFGVLFTALIINSIIRPMQTTVHALRQVNAGETSIDLPPVSQDEFGDMAVALRQFRDQAERLRRLAYGDVLTGLGNRAQLEESLREQLIRSKQGRGEAALLFIDLDNFRSVNESLGHGIGDRYICEAAARLQRFLPQDAVLCRHGGDKFAVVLSMSHGSEMRSEIETLTRGLLQGMSEPYPIGDHLLPMSVSVGVAVYPSDGQSSESLTSSAEAAMYLAKRHGRNNAQFASPELTGDARKQLAIVTEIRLGLENDEFEPFYQPIVDVVRGEVTGAEALLRWHHSRRGVVAAGEFIPAAEASGLIHALGEACVRKAHAQFLRWAQEGEPIRISVNLSARQIEDRTALALIEELDGASNRHGGLDFELTETAILQHIDQAQETLRRIRALGHKLIVDDFGTGYSSLVYLQRFPVDRIKIDRSFVSRIESSREARAIVAATVVLARSLELEVVAEGVETIGQLCRLRDLGCVYQQGFYFTAALSAPEFDAWRHGAFRRLDLAAHLGAESSGDLKLA